jgi:hypothetical protein
VEHRIHASWEVHQLVAALVALKVHEGALKRQLSLSGKTYPMIILPARAGRG